MAPPPAGQAPAPMHPAIQAPAAAKARPGIVRATVVSGSPDQTWFSGTAIMRDSAGRAPSIRSALGSDPLTGEQPVVRDDDVSPIFASLESEWFTRRTAMVNRSMAASQGATADHGADEPVVVRHSPEDWRSPGDEGWRRAAEVAAQKEEPPMVTNDGLPVRVPGQNLIPGAARIDTPPAGTAVPSGVEERRVRGLASFQQGVSRARNTEPAAGAAGRPEGENLR